MPYITPAMNTLWFCFENEDNRRALHGTPVDCMRKYEALATQNIIEDGVEIFLMPSRLENVEEFDGWFYEKFSKLKYGTVHIGETDPEFLIAADGIAEKMDILMRMIERLEAKAVIIHASHFRTDRSKKYQLLQETLPGVPVCIENDGMDSPWGRTVEDLLGIFKDCPSFEFCLDICHVKDISKNSMEEFFSTPDLLSRLKEIHYSYSTRSRSEEGDLYEKRGFPGYGPYHGLWSVLGLRPSDETMQYILNYPIIMEGVVPWEDTRLNYLKEERDALLR